MFSFALPIGGFKSLTTYTDGVIRFNPPAFEQRYGATIQILDDPRWAKQIKKVTDFGCGAMRFLPLLRRCETIQEILEVDIDEDVLKASCLRAEPLCGDFLKKRQHPLRIDIFQGNAAEYSHQLKNTDAVIALELIENVQENVLCKISENIFNNIQPKIAIISTPNVEFNTLFKRLANGYRHRDHQFEWTRAEFKNWCEEIILQYPHYSYAVKGVGNPPEGYEYFGEVSQIGVFVRKDVLGITINPYIKRSVLNTSAYKLIHRVIYPFLKDKPNKSEKKNKNQIKKSVHSKYNRNASGNNNRYSGRPKATRGPSSSKSNNKV